MKRITAQEEVAAPAVNADEHKQMNLLRKQLRKSRERIMRLKDLSMKLRNGNIQELKACLALQAQRNCLAGTARF